MRRALAVLSLTLCVACIFWWFATAPAEDDAADGTHQDLRGGSSRPSAGTIRTEVAGGLAVTDVQLTTKIGNVSIEWPLPPDAHLISLDFGTSVGVVEGRVLESGQVRELTPWLTEWRVAEDRIHFAYETETPSPVHFRYLHPVPFQDGARHLSYIEPTLSIIVSWDVHIDVQRAHGLQAVQTHGGLAVSQQTSDAFVARGTTSMLSAASVSWQEPVRQVHVEAHCEAGRSDTGILLLSPTSTQHWPRHVSFILDPRIVGVTKAVDAIAAMVQDLEPTATWDAVLASDPPLRLSLRDLRALDTGRSAVDFQQALAATQAEAAASLQGKEAVWDLVWAIDRSNATDRPSSFDVAGAVVHVVPYDGGATAPEKATFPPGTVATSLARIGAPHLRDLRVHVEGLGDQTFGGQAALVREGGTRIAGFSGAWQDGQRLRVEVTGEAVDGHVRQQYAFEQHECKETAGASSLGAREGTPTRDEALLHSIVVPGTGWEAVLAGTDPPRVLMPAPSEPRLSEVQGLSFWFAYRNAALPLAAVFALFGLVLLRDRRDGTTARADSGRAP